MIKMGRLPGGGLIDRTNSLTFEFDGRRYGGFAGDTLASALLANRVRLLGRSFKYHRPRGLIAAGSEEPNALVELRNQSRREPNTRATTVELYDGLVACSQNRWPSLKLDILSVNSVLSPLLVAGFYYKTFMWPAAFWERVYEPVIRRAAGLGRASGLEDPDHYEKRHAFCDVLVIGAGPAGLRAALEAARAGARVILCEEDFRLGGRLLTESLQIESLSGPQWTQMVEDELRAIREVTLLTRTSVFGSYDSGVFGALERMADHRLEPRECEARQRLWKIKARTAVVATGALERPIVFGGNDRPGVMLASAVRTYLRRFGVAPGERAAVFTSTDDGWKTVSDLAAAGIRVEAVIDPRAEGAPGLVDIARRADARVYSGSEVIGTSGRLGLRSIEIRDRNGVRSRLPVNLLAVSGGFTPQVALTTHLGAKPRWLAHASAFVPDVAHPGMFCAGAVTGAFSLAEALEQGAQAGKLAAEAAGHSVAGAPKKLLTSDEPHHVVAHGIVKGTTQKAFVDLQNDVTARDIEVAVSEGFRSVEHVKRYTTLGMATDQGKTSNANGNALTAELTARSLAETGSPVLRPPSVPVAIGAFAGEHRGRNFKPTRVTSGHDWAVERGAVFMDVGNWRRAQFFPRAGERTWLEVTCREVRTVRSCVGVCDVSTLGKIDIQGPDASLLLDRVYTSQFSTLRIGRVRYGFMLSEDGFVMDDGTTTRFGPDRYLMSTTTAGIGLVLRHLDYCRQVLWPELDVSVTSVTEQWAQYSIAGPKARMVLQRLLGGGVDVSNESLPYMGAVEFLFGEVPTRVFRLSFSGELAYEIAVPACFGDSLIRAILLAGEPFGITPYGLEALGAMALEKGHISGAEMNGQTTLADLGFARLMSPLKDCIGRTLSQRPALADPDRPVLVGLRGVRAGQSFNSGGLLVRPDHGRKAELGYVTSAGFSPTLGEWLGLGLLQRGRERIGQRFHVFDGVRGEEVPVLVCSPCFYDPQGVRLRV
jgi:methylglutamate dehydrogenase subunit C